MGAQGKGSEKPDEIYEMTWFDVFRLDPDSGLIDEHWDSSERWDSEGAPPGAEFFPDTNFKIDKLLHSVVFTLLHFLIH